MEIETYIKKLKDTHNSLISYIEATDDSDLKFNELAENLNNFKNEDDSLLFRLIESISANHHREPDFFMKIENVMQYQFKNKQIPILDIIDFDSTTKRLLFSVIEKQIFLLNSDFIYFYFRKLKQSDLFYYLYPAVKSILKKESRDKIEKEILKKFQIDIKSFEEKCRIGENDSYICTLIRNDSIEEFIAYVNKTNLPLKSKIQSSYFETNPFLNNRQLSLIEYATFCASIKVFNYLLSQGTKLTQELWIYAIHSNSAEIIQILEDNEVPIGFNKNEKYQVKECLSESIKCHHNDITNYIKDNKIEWQHFDDQSLIEEFKRSIIESLNYGHFPDEIGYLITRSSLKSRESTNAFSFSPPWHELSSSKIIYYMDRGHILIKDICFCVKTVTIPSSLTFIGDFAFSECDNITQIIIPSSVKSIGKFAFYSCPKLAQIEFPSSVTTIEEGTFKECSCLSQFTIHLGVTEIESNAFNGCRSLTQLEVPSSVRKIGEGAFGNCSSLTSISIHSSLPCIDNWTFFKCSSLKQIEIPSSAKFIGICAFFSCSSLTEVLMPSSVTSIKENAFCKCKSLVKIKVPSTVKSIGKGAFSYCESLKDFIIPTSISEIQDMMFYNCSSLTRITIPSSVSKIGSYSFSKCSLLSDVIIPDSVGCIGHYSFSFCTSIKQIKIPDVTEISDGLFANCSSLEQFEIPSSVTVVGGYAFRECSSLKRIDINAPLSVIHPLTFFKCSSLTNIKLPSSVECIFDFAFAGCSNLKKIELPFDLKTIGIYAFAFCSSLSQIDIPRSVISVDNHAFDGCSSLEKFEVPSNKIFIGLDALIKCFALEHVTVPEFLEIERIGIPSNIDVKRVCTNQSGECASFE